MLGDDLKNRCVTPFIWNAQNGKSIETGSGHQGLGKAENGERLSIVADLLLGMMKTLWN
jgi:hypothetical protein